MEFRHKEAHEDSGEQLLHCRNCDGYYDPSLPNCPHCGEDTANNVNNSRARSSVTQYEGGFGEAGSILSRVAAGMVAVLLAVGLLGGGVMGVRMVAQRPGLTPSADTSAPAEGSAAASASVQSDKKEKKKKDKEPDQIPPEALRLDYSDLTLVNEGESYQFQVTVEPEDWEGELTWTTDNQNVAVVTPEGKLKSVGKGECGITLSVGEVSYRCLVRCKSGAESDEGGSASVDAYYINGKIMSVDDAQKVIEEERAKAAEKKRKEEEKKRKEEEERKRKEEEKKKKEAEEAKRKEEERKRKEKEEEEKRKAEEQARKEKEAEEERARKEKEAEEKAAQEEKERQEAEEKAAQEEKKKKSNSNSITLQYYDITLVHVGDSFQFEPSGGDGKSYKWSSANGDVASVSSDGNVTATGVGQTTLTCKSGDSSVDVIVRVRSK